MDRKVRISVAVVLATLALTAVVTAPASTTSPAGSETGEPAPAVTFTYVSDRRLPPPNILRRNARSSTLGTYRPPGVGQLIRLDLGQNEDKPANGPNNRPAP